MLTSFLLPVAGLGLFNVTVTDFKALVQRPVAVYVEKGYEEGDFSLLGIGT